MLWFHMASAFWFLIAFLIYFPPPFAELHQTIDDGQFGIHSKLDKISPLITTCYTIYKCPEDSNTVKVIICVLKVIR